MEPGSASVAFLGLAGSIATLAGIVVESCKTVHKVWHCLKEAPQDVRRLFKRLKRLETLILEIKRAGDKLGGDTARLDLQQDWLGQVEEMLDDFTILKAKIGKLEGNLHGRALSRKRIHAQIHKIFSAEDITKYERMLSGHLETFNMMLVLITRYRAFHSSYFANSCVNLNRSNVTNITLAETRTQTKALNKMASSAHRLERSIQIALAEEIPPSQYGRDNLVRRVRRQMMALSCKGCNKDEQLAIKFLHDMSASSESLRLETQSSLIPVSNLHELPDLRREPSQNETVIHRTNLNNHNTNVPQELGSNKEAIHPSLPFATRPNAYPTRTLRVLGRLSIYHFPVGVLTIGVTKKMTTAQDPARKKSNTYSYAIEVFLYPAWWIANGVILFSVSVSTAVGGGHSMGWKFKQEYYNDNPSLVRCLAQADLSGLQQLFAKGLARPTDRLAPWANSLLHVTCLAPY